MNKLYSYDNFEGDKGVIIARSYEDAVALYKKEYPKRQIAKTEAEYYNHGCYLTENDVVETGKLYCTCPW